MICDACGHDHAVSGVADHETCSACGGYVITYLRMKGCMCHCPTLQTMIDLKSFGYKAAPEARYAGGPSVLRRPDGTYVREGEFVRELERVLSA